MSYKRYSNCPAQQEIESSVPETPEYQAFDELFSYGFTGMWGLERPPSFKRTPKIDELEGWN